MISDGRCARNSSFKPALSGAPPDSRTRERLQVVRRGVELVEQRPGERVADDQQEVQPLALDQPPDVGGVEALGDRLHEDGAAEVPRAEAHPVPGAVHERRREQRLQPAVGRGDDLLERVGAAEPPKHSTLASPLRHSTPFGMPVVPPV